MIRKSLCAIFMMASIALLSACVNQPMEQIQSQNIPNGLSSAQIQHAIKTAGKKDHWVFTSAKPGLMDGRLNWKGHYVHVQVPYTSKKYSIVYKDSYNMDVNKKEGKIRRGYNRWVVNLNRNIQNQLNIAAHKHR